MTTTAQSSAESIAVAGFLDTCRSSNTRRAYEGDLAHLAAWCRGQGSLDLMSISVADVARYRTACELAGARPATVARRLSTIASFSAFAARGAEPGVEGARAIARPSVEPESSAELLHDDEAAALLAAADRAGQRSAAMVRLLMLDGLKVGELIRADSADVGGRPPRMTLGLHDDRKHRVIDVHPDTASSMHRYLGRRRIGPLFLSEQRGRTPARLTRFGVDYLVKRVADAAGVDHPVSANALRRRYVVAAHADGAGLETIRQSIGLSGSRTARRYLAPTRDASIDPDG